MELAYSGAGGAIKACAQAAGIVFSASEKRLKVMIPVAMASMTSHHALGQYIR